MGRIYQLASAGTVSTSVLEFFCIVPADNKPVALRGFRLGQTTVVKDANETAQSLIVRIASGTLSPGSGGSVASAYKRVLTDPSAGFTARMLDTTASTGTSYNNVLCDAFNLRGGYEIWWPPDLAPMARDGQYLQIVLNGTPPTAFAASFTAWLEEF